MTNYLHYISTCIGIIGSKLGNVATFCERIPPLKSHASLITWPTWGKVTNWKKNISFFTRLMTAKLDMMVILGGTPTHKTKWPFDHVVHVVIWDHMTNKKNFISTSTKPMATRIYRVVNYWKAFLLVMPPGYLENCWTEKWFLHKWLVNVSIVTGSMIFIVQIYLVT